MNFSQIKTQIPGYAGNVLQYNLAKIPNATDPNKIDEAATAWLNDTRIRVIMSADLFDKLSNGMELNNLGIKFKDKVSSPQSKTPGQPYKIAAVFQYTLGDLGEL